MKVLRSVRKSSNNFNVTNSPSIVQPQQSTQNEGSVEPHPIDTPLTDDPTRVCNPVLSSNADVATMPSDEFTEIKLTDHESKPSVAASPLTLLPFPSSASAYMVESATTVIPVEETLIVSEVMTSPLVSLLSMLKSP
jgi:hypothetical protein